jgi:flagellar basal body P-ring formation protein FlgA
MGSIRAGSIRVNDSRLIDERLRASRRYAHEHDSVRVRSGASLAVRIAFVTIILTLVYSVYATVASAAEPLAAATRTVQSIASIREAAAQFVRDNSRGIAPANSNLSATATELDARLQLDQCAAALKAFALNEASIGTRTTIGVRCDQGAAWTVYVPVIVESEIDVLVLKNSLPREAHVASSDFEVQRRRVPGFGSAYISNTTTLRDQHLKRTAVAGTVLTADLLTRDFVVKRGQQVMLVFDAHGLAVQAPGLALSDGGTADRIRVQNQTSLKVVEGIVESGNLVRVGM